MRQLRAEERTRLEAQGCTALDWSRVQVDDTTDLSRIRSVSFAGDVAIGRNTGTVVIGGIRVPCEVSHAVLADCSIGADAFVSRIGSRISGVDVGDGAVVENVAELTASPDASFGEGIDVEVVNEAGGRGVTLHAELTAQTAYVQAFRLHRPGVAAGIRALAQRSAGSRHGRGFVGSGASVRNAGAVVDVRIGPAARIDGPSSLVDGTILSCPEHPTVVGTGVQARHFVFAEGSIVGSGALLERVFVGQASRVGKQFSAENALFFANCEGFHGEAVALLAGPYTVTHHKSTLLIAAACSFYNAGSGTNQSNHMYKLGPVHQGLFERGCKTGSFSYVLHETHVGAFSVVIGKHYTNIDTPDFPFSYIHESDGQSLIVPGMNLFSVGTVRDGEKWPKRDGRKAPTRRDLITFDVFSPYTVEKMRRGRDLLRSLQESTPKERNAVPLGGVMMKRLLLRKCAKYYQQAIVRYLAGELFGRLTPLLEGGARWEEAVGRLRPTDPLSEPGAWTDVGGLLMPVEVLTGIESGLDEGRFGDHAALLRAFADAAARVPAWSWTYVCHALRQESDVDPASLTRQQALELLDAYRDASTALLGMIIDDAGKEFDAFARIGFGVSMSDEDRARDFAAVRGTEEGNAVLKNLRAGKQDLVSRVENLRRLFAS